MFTRYNVIFRAFPYSHKVLAIGLFGIQAGLNWEAEINTMNADAWLPASPGPSWRHQMEVFSALLALCEGNSPVTGEFPSQRDSNSDFGVSLMWVRISC